MNHENNLIGKFIGVYNENNNLVGKRKIVNAFSIENLAGSFITVNNNSGKVIGYAEGLYIIDNQHQLNSVPEFEEVK